MSLLLSFESRVQCLKHSSSWKLPTCMTLGVFRETTDSVFLHRRSATQTTSVWLNMEIKELLKNIKWTWSCKKKKRTKPKKPKKQKTIRHYETTVWNKTKQKQKSHIKSHFKVFWSSSPALFRSHGMWLSDFWAVTLINLMPRQTVHIIKSLQRARTMRGNVLL